MTLPAARFAFHDCNGVRLHVAEAGPADGPVVMLLHGFPEFWFGWRDQIGALVDAGYCVIAPDQRGYNLSGKPTGVAAYDVDRLADDVLALADVYGQRRLRLVGHDWGGLVAWWLATRSPERLERVAVLNCVHPAVWRDAMDHDPVQRRASSYVRRLAIPFLPELMLRRRHNAALVAALRGSTAPLSDADADRYREAWGQPGALTAMVNWYRAILKRRFTMPPQGSLPVPMQIIWGSRDRYALPALATASQALCANAAIEFLPDATHWVTHDDAARVNRLLIDFLRA